MEVPEDADAQVVVVVPGRVVAVDVPALPVEVADVDPVAVRIEKLPSSHPCHRKARDRFSLPEFYPGAIPALCREYLR